MRPSAVLIFALSVMPGFFCCNLRTKQKNRAKIVEDYVLSANFDEKKDVPQLGDHLREDSPEAKDGSQTLLAYKSQGGFVNDLEDRIPLEERDLLVHHHHAPPPLPLPPPPPPPPIGLALAPSMYAIGLIGFLILLNGLSSQLIMVLKTKAGLLSTGANVLGRRRRRRDADVSRLGLHTKIQLD